MSQHKIELLNGMEENLRNVWVKYHYYIMLEHSGVSPVQLFLLRFLKFNQLCKPTDIAKEFGITLGACTGLVDRLVKQGLVIRQRGEKDRRTVSIILTEKGTELINSFEEQRIVKLLAMVDRLGTTDLVSLTSLLGKVNNILGMFSEADICADNDN